MRWTPKRDDVALPPEGAGAPAAGFIQTCRCGFEIRSIRLVLAECPRCHRVGAEAWVKVVCRHRGYPSIELVPDPQFLATLQPGAGGSPRGRSAGAKIRAWVRSWVKLQRPRTAR